jgi:hypothetical protein
MRVEPELMRTIETKGPGGWIEIYRVGRGAYWLTGTYHLMGMYVREEFDGSLADAVRFAKKILQIPYKPSKVVK